MKTMALSVKLFMRHYTSPLNSEEVSDREPRRNRSAVGRHHSLDLVPQPAVHNCRVLAPMGRIFMVHLSPVEVAVTPLPGTNTSPSTTTRVKSSSGLSRSSQPGLRKGACALYQSQNSPPPFARITIERASALILPVW